MIVQNAPTENQNLMYDAVKYDKIYQERWNKKINAEEIPEFVKDSFRLLHRYYRYYYVAANDSPNLTSKHEDIISYYGKALELKPNETNDKYLDHNGDASVLYVLSGLFVLGWPLIPGETDQNPNQIWDEKKAPACICKMRDYARTFFWIYLKCDDTWNKLKTQVDTKNKKGTLDYINDLLMVLDLQIRVAENLETPPESFATLKNAISDDSMTFSKLRSLLKKLAKSENDENIKMILNNLKLWLD